MSDNNDKLAKFMFEGKELTFYNFKGRQCVIARSFGVHLTYGEEGKGLTDSITSEAKWANEFLKGADYDILEGQDLQDFKDVFQRGADSAPRSKVNSLMVLYESGCYLAAIKTAKPIGIKLRRFLADDVLPALRRGEAILGKAEATGWTDEKFNAVKKHLRDRVAIGVMPEEDALNQITLVLRE